MAYGPIDKPAETADLKFPSRTPASGDRRALLGFPARHRLLGKGVQVREKKEHLSFHMGRDAPPSLLETLYRLGG